MKTPAQNERALERAFDRVLREHLHDPDALADGIAEARDTYRRIRAGYGFKSTAPLLSVEIAKTQKNEHVTYALALLPADVSGLVDVCPFEDACARTCVAFSGNGRYDSTHRTRQARTDLMVNHPHAFAHLLYAELMHADSQHLDGFAVRLNAFSDIRWERVAGWLFAVLDGVEFYDYTKHTLASRPAHTLPANYRLTYSVSPRTKLTEARASLDAGRNVAVVFASRAHSKNDALPDTWCGHEVIDGDKTDERYRDPVGVVVGLRRKGSLLAGGELVRAGERLADEASRATEYGNAHACTNCGDEWSTYDARGLCTDCADVLQEGAK